MSDLEESNPFDIEAQQSLLLPTHEPESTSRQTLQTIILLMRSADLFKLSGENYSTFSSSSDSSVSILSPAYTSVGTADGQDNAGPEIVEAAHVSRALHEDSLTVESTPQNEFTSTIELQCIQMGNITEMVKRMNLEELHNYGGVQGVAHALNTDHINGLSDDHEAISKCNTNELSQSLTFFHFFKEGCNKYSIFLLSLAAVLSLSFGIKKEGVANGWFDGTILIVAIFVLVVFIAIRSYSQARWYHKKFQKQWFSEGRNGKVKVIRSGRPPLAVPSSDLRVGDLVCLQKGYQVPADGIFVDGQVLQLDDGLSLTIDNSNPFLFYGSRVINGDARMIVTSVGMDTVWGEMIGKEIESTEKKCEVEVLLHKLRTSVDFIGLLLSILILIVMFLRYSLGKRDDESGYRPDPKGEPTRLKIIIDVIKEIIIESKGTARVLIASLSVSVVGIMEGIPFVISFAVAHRSRKTLAENASEKDPLACVKVASVTAICTDKFGGLTENQKEVDKLFVDKEFVGQSSTVSPDVLESLCDGIGISLLSSSPRGNDLNVLVSWAEEKFGLRSETLKRQCRIVKHKEGNLSEYSGALLLKTTENGQQWHLHYTGSPQDILSMCSDYYNVEGEMHTIDGEKRRMFERASDYMLDGQEVIAYACKPTDESNDMSIEANDLIFVGMVGLRNINQDYIRKAVSTLREGGVRTILVSGDCIDVLRTIGNNCGLLTPELDALTGEEFRNLTDEERKQKLDTICIMGSCTLHDKVLLVKCLREKGEVVAMLGQKTNDAPALKEADIGLTLGTWSSEMARDCSEIIIWNGDITFLVNLIENGRCIYENIRKFIQFQLIITISSSLINFIATIVWGDAPMTAFELFWLNSVVAMLGGLALLTEWPKEILMKMSLKSRGQLITKAMWRNIAVQASYQTAICLTLRLKGRAILGIGAGHIKSMIYNSLFLCQLFNKFIARELEKKNIFKGLHQNRWFWVACVLFLICQAAMVAAENVFDISTRLKWMLWASCILIGLVSWPLDFAGKWIGSLGFHS